MIEQDEIKHDGQNAHRLNLLVFVSIWCVAEFDRSIDQDTSDLLITVLHLASITSVSNRLWTASNHTRLQFIPAHAVAMPLELYFTKKHTAAE